MQLILRASPSASIDSLCCVSLAVYIIFYSYRPSVQLSSASYYTCCSLAPVDPLWHTSHSLLEFICNVFMLLLQLYKRHFCHQLCSSICSFELEFLVSRGTTHGRGAFFCETFEISNPDVPFLRNNKRSSKSLAATGYQQQRGRP